MLVCLPRNLSSLHRTLDLFINRVMNRVNWVILVFEHNINKYASLEYLGKAEICNLYSKIEKH